MTRRRRELLLGAAASVAAVASLPAPAIAQGIKELKMVTSWPKGMLGLDTSAERLAQTITVLSDGHLKVTVYAAGSLVGPFEVFDAVAAAVADMYHATDYYFEAKSPALNFFAAAPYGLTGDELCAWIDFGGGQALWDEVDAQFNIKPLMVLNTGVQMGGWYSKEVNHPQDYKGLRYRMPGLGVEVLRRMGAEAVTIPGGDIIGALKSGAIDGSEWVGPWVDMDLGLDKAADYYYYPGFHEPGTNSTLGINKTLWDGLTASERALIEAAAQAEVTRSLAEFNAENVKALKVLRAEERIKILRFNDELIKTFGKLSKEVLADTAAKDPLTRKVYDSYMAFLAGVMDWGELSETGYRDTRRLALAYKETAMTRRRREVLLGATAALAATGGLLAPAIAQGIKDLKLVTDWPEGLAGLDTGAQRLARSITAISDGRLKVTVYPSGSLVRPLETFDAVAAGVADMYHSFDPYFEGKSPALYFFGTVPFGLTGDELCSWIDFGGGQALWDEVDAQFNIKALMATQTGVQMGGWFSKEINGPEDYKGLRYRMPGLGAEVLRRMGATVVTVPAVDIVKAIRTGAIDGAEWIGPWPDIDLGLDKVADYYYHPGFHEPGTNLTLGINKRLWDGLSNSERALIEAAAQAEVTRSLAEFNAENVKWLKVLRADERIKIRRFSDELLKVFGKLSKEVLADTATKDPLTRKVYDSYMAFLAGVMDWGELSETGYRDTRRLALA